MNVLNATLKRVDSGVLLNRETKTKRNETKYNETKRKMKKRNETKYIKQSIKDPKTINEGVKINEILSG
jgi:hypothetical protein